ncbi:MAG: ABC transporter ATP-binding protein [Caldilineaceae bacterium]
MIYFVWPYRWIAALTLLTTVLPVAMELVTPRMLQTMIDGGIRGGSMAVVWQSALWMLAASVIGAVATVAQGFYRARLSQGIAFDMRNDLFAHIQAFSWANLDQMQTGQLMTRVSSDVDTVRMFTSAGLSLLLRAILMIVGSVIMLVITDWQLSIIIFVLLGLAGILLRTLVATTQPLFTLVQQKLAAMNTLVQENLAGIRVVKAYVRERYAIDRFLGASEDYRDQNIRVGRIMALATPVLGLLTNLGMVAILWWGGLDVIGGRLSVGQLVAFNNYLMIGMAPLLLLSNMMMMVSRAEASATRIFEVLDMQPRIRPAAQPYRPQGRVQGRVVFSNVSYGYERFTPIGNPPPQPQTLTSQGAAANGHQRNGRYPNSDQANGQHGNGHQTNGHLISSEGGPVHYGVGQEDVLRGVSFVAEPGQWIALLGATGSGKSTLVHLIPRFYDVDGGRIAVDGIDLREWAPDVLRRNIGVVLQETILFSGTVRENIAYGRPDATLEEVIAAAKAAQAHDFIIAMPDQYESRVEERGANLSGGQKQRIAIARALLIDPAILIMDDSTSAVDFETEVRLQQALETLMQGRTTFIVAQRINSVLKADQIFVLDGGRIVAQGTHRELLADSPLYQEIYQSQLGENDPTRTPGQQAEDRMAG